MFIKNEDMKKVKRVRIVALAAAAFIITALITSTIVLGFYMIRENQADNNTNISYPEVVFAGNGYNYRIVDENVFEVTQFKKINLDTKIEYWYKYSDNGIVRDNKFDGQPVHIEGNLTLTYTVDMNRGVVITRNGVTTPLREFVSPEIPDVALRYHLPESIVYSDRDAIDMSDCIVQFGNTTVADATVIIGSFRLSHVDQDVSLNITVNGNTTHVTVSNHQ